MSAAIFRSDDLPGIATLSIRRPERLNALDGPSADELRAAIVAAAAETAIKAIVVKGEGKAFSTGLDLSGVDPDGEINLGAVLEHHFEPLVNAIRSSPVPVVAAVNGPAAGVSVAVALAADICIASEAAYFLLPFTSLGVLPDGGLTWLLPRLIGAQRAAAVTLLAERIPAAAAVNWGLIWKSVPATDFDQAVRDCAERLASLPRTALSATKQALRQSAMSSFDDHLRCERDLQQALGRTLEFRENLKRFIRRS